MLRMISASSSFIYAYKVCLMIQLSFLFSETTGHSGFSEGSSNGVKESPGEDT